MNQNYALTFDANLVRVFLAIWDTRSLTAAGDRLGLTQPAVSHALRRLRERFDDPLFVRDRAGMEPTGKAIRLHGPFRLALDAIAGAVTGGGQFDPATARLRFRIAMSDVSEMYFLPRLLAWMADMAPGISIESIPLDAESAAAWLRRGEVDLALGHAPQLESECASEMLIRDRLVCLVRRGHPLAETPLTLERFIDLHHVDAGSHAPGHGAVDLQLAMLGLQRRIAVRVRHLVTAPPLVSATDLAVVYPQSLATELVRAGGFHAMDLPFASLPMDVKLHIHRSALEQADIAWLGKAVCSLFPCSD